MKKKRKKSLVGWLYKGWRKDFKFNDNGYGEGICHTPWLMNTYDSITDSYKKVRITIEEL